MLLVTYHLNFLLYLCFDLQRADAQHGMTRQGLERERLQQVLTFVCMRFN